MFGRFWNTAVFLLLAVALEPRAVLGHGFHGNGRVLQQGDDTQHRTCGTRDPTLEEIERAIEVERLYFESLAEQQTDDASVTQPSTSPAASTLAPTIRVRQLLSNPFSGGAVVGPPTPMKSNPPCPPETPVMYVVPTYYHALASTAGSTTITNATVEQQHAHLNNAFCGSGFSFQLINISRTLNNVWYNGDDVAGMKSNLRRGGQDSLNVYLNNPGDDLLGFATFPDGEPLLDGVVVNDKSLPGGPLSNYNDGDTLVHEVGHWLGLFHTFQNRCAPPGDGVDDTPAQSTPTSGCPATLPDSCFSVSGFDNVNNFMDYSYDTCMFEFTQGQINRMISQWNTYRATA